MSLIFLRVRYWEDGAISWKPPFLCIFLSLLLSANAKAWEEGGRGRGQLSSLLNCLLCFAIFTLTAAPVTCNAQNQRASSFFKFFCLVITPQYEIFFQVIITTKDF